MNRREVSFVCHHPYSTVRSSQAGLKSESGLQRAAQREIGILNGLRGVAPGNAIVTVDNLLYALADNPEPELLASCRWKHDAHNVPRP